MFYAIEKAAALGMEQLSELFLLYPGGNKKASVTARPIGERPGNKINDRSAASPFAASLSN